MTGQNIENIFNLALSTSPEERAKTENLNVGYNPLNEEWEIILKYSGTVDEISKNVKALVILRSGYAVATVTEEQLRIVSKIPQVEYIEKPKKLFFQTENGRRVSCIDAVQEPFFYPEGLLGEGVLIGILDSGIDIRNRDFRDENGKTRIIRLWDQTMPGKPPLGYDKGSEYDEETLNEFLNDPTVREMPGMDTSGHGTAVAGIAAGNGRENGKAFRGVACKAKLVIVKLGRPARQGFPRTTELMKGLNYLMDVAQTMKMPIAVNISFGNTYGSHNGTSLLEKYIDEITNVGRNVICVGMGNEGTGIGHTSGSVNREMEEIVELFVQQQQSGFSLQIWKDYVDEIGIAFLSPSGEMAGPVALKLGTQRFQAGNTRILLYYGEPKPYSIAQEIYVEFVPEQEYVTPGIWEIILTPVKIIRGNYEMWLPTQKILNIGTGFAKSNEKITLTIPATSRQVISVGAYDAENRVYAGFSGRGYILGDGQVKPDLTAPGVDIITTASGGGAVTVSGTSFATPFVTGAAALLMEWGIVRGNDPYLYGEKVRAYLRKGAKPLPAFKKYPNTLTGFGALCLKDSIPSERI